MTRAPGLQHPMVREAAQALRAGNTARAEELCRGTLAHDPANIEALRVLAAALRRGGRHPEAVALLERAAAERPNLPGILGELGLTYQGVGRTREAVEVFRRVTALAPAAAAGHLHLGRALLEAFEVTAAVASLEKADALAPGTPDIQGSLGGAYVTHGMSHKAEPLLRAALASRPDSPDLHWALASALRATGRAEDAIGEYRKARELRPGQAHTDAGEIEALESLGRSDEAWELLGRAIERGAEDPHLAMAYARIGEKRGKAAEIEAVLRRLLGRPTRIQGHRSMLLFALGANLERQGRADEAWAAYAEANSLYGQRVDLGEFRVAIDKLIGVYSAAALRSLPRATSASPLPVFIVGMPRSGTSLVEEVLASHRAVHGAGELGDITAIVQNLPVSLGASAPYPECAQLIRPGTADAIASAHLARLAALAAGAGRAGAERVTDKMPTNFMHLGLIALLFPGARVIHCSRHPLDNAVSIFATRLGPGHVYANRTEDIGEYYTQYRRLMEHWRTALPIPMLDVGYEQMVAEPERMSRAIVEFVGLPWDDACLRFYENKRVVTTASRDQVKKPVYDSSIGRWKKFEKHLGGLRSALAPFLPPEDRPRP